MRNIFEKATKDKIRFEHKGILSTEDLWDLDVISLDSIFKGLNANKKQESEESLLETKTAEDTLLNAQIKIITHIVEFKLAEKQTRLLLAEKKDKKEKIMAIIASKQDNALENKSETQLKKMLADL